MSVSNMLTPPDEAVFYTRNDANDRRLGDMALRGMAASDQANVILIGCPQDEGVRRNNGRVGAALAPHHIRQALYRYPLAREHAGLKLCDWGNIIPGDDLESTHQRLQDVVGGALSHVKTVVVLGGGNDISYADCRAISQQHAPVLAFNLDRHLDVRADECRNSGTPYRMLLDEGWIEPGNFHEVGTNSFANSQVYLDYVSGLGAHIHYLGDLRNRGVGLTLDRILSDSEAASCFFGFDMDVVRAMEAPGVSDPSPMGLTAREICEAADAAAQDQRPKIIEITEVNPEYDVDNITAKLAANIIMRSLAVRV